MEVIPAAEIDDYLRKHVPRGQRRAFDDAIRWLDQRFIGHIRKARDKKSDEPRRRKTK